MFGCVHIRSYSSKRTLHSLPEILSVFQANHNRDSFPASWVLSTAPTTSFLAFGSTLLCLPSCAVTMMRLGPALRSTLQMQRWIYQAKRQKQVCCQEPNQACAGGLRKKCRYHALQLAPLDSVSRWSSAGNAREPPKNHGRVCGLALPAQPVLAYAVACTTLRRGAATSRRRRQAVWCLGDPELGALGP